MHCFGLSLRQRIGNKVMIKSAYLQVKITGQGNTIAPIGYKCHLCIEKTISGKTVDNMFQEMWDTDLMQCLRDYFSVRDVDLWAIMNYLRLSLAN
jgi:hypothetical protein